MHTGIMLKLCMMQLSVLLKKACIIYIYISVSGDGTWRKRGFSSSFGVVTVLSTITGKALDCEIMSKKCGECKLKRGKKGTEEFDEWWEQQHKCHANFAGSSGSMDSAGMLAI